MHSFDARDNKIKWKLHVHGDVPHWPDINDAWDVTLMPGEANGD